MRFLILLLALAAPLGFAADASLTWQHPSRNVDNSLIPATGPGSIAATRVEYGTCNGTAFGTAEGQQVFTGTVTTGTITGLTAGRSYCFRAFSRNTFGEESAASNVVARAIPAPTPQPPVLSSTISIAYEERRFLWFRYLAAAGSIPEASPCMESVTITAAGRLLHGIDAQYVQVFAGRKPGKLYTVCG